MRHVQSFGGRYVDFNSHWAWSFDHLPLSLEFCTCPYTTSSYHRLHVGKYRGLWQQSHQPDDLIMRIMSGGMLPWAPAGQNAVKPQCPQAGYPGRWSGLRVDTRLEICRQAVCGQFSPWMLHNRPNHATSTAQSLHSASLDFSFSRLKRLR